MGKVPTRKVKAAAFSRPRRKTFDAAVKAVAACVGARRINVTPISIFSRHPFAMLKRIRAGSVEVVTNRGEPFVVLGMSQLLAIIADQSVGRVTAAEVLARQRTIAISPSMSRHRSVQTWSHHRVPRFST